jgi:ribonuclease P protein component
LRRSADFAALTGERAKFRRARRWLVLAARIVDEPALDASSAVCIGVTVGKRQARRAVDRSAVKRVLREAARTAGPDLDQAAGARRVHAVLRLKAPLPAAQSVSHRALKRLLRAEADELLVELVRYMTPTQPTSP